MARRQSRQTDGEANRFRPLPSSITNFVASELSLPPNSSIFRTPKILSRHNEQAYRPNAFSFGPLHFGDEQLELTQKIKLKYLQSLLRRSSNSEQLYRDLVEGIRSVRGKIRSCYAGPIEPCDEEGLVEIVVLDGCFIIELFRKDAGEVTVDKDDPTFSMSSLLENLKHDLILLENQIPWLVLESLFNLTSSFSPGKPLIQLALDYFSNMFSSSKPSINPSEFANVEVKHILDLLRHSLLLPLKSQHDDAVSENFSVWEPLPCATKIHEAGIKFKKVSAESILDVQFKNGVLEIPSLLIQETTESIFRNLISFEQVCPNYQPIVTSYAKLMDNLIDTDKDVEILCDKDILDNWLNPGDVKNYFNKLYNDAYVKKFYYGKLCQDVNRHRKRCWPRWRFVYMHNYFGTPWAIVSQAAATILLVLTFLQTLYAILGFQNQNQKH